MFFKIVRYQNEVECTLTFNCKLYGRLLSVGSAVTTVTSPKFNNKPFMKLQKKKSKRCSIIFDSSECAFRYRCIHLKLKSDKTKTPLWLVCNLSIFLENSSSHRSVHAIREKCDHISRITGTVCRVWGECVYLYIQILSSREDRVPLIFAVRRYSL